jgi:hypothetical protein
MVNSNARRHFIGLKNSTPKNGFFWMIYGDITNVNVELIFKEIFKGAYARKKNSKNSDC